jgi:UDP-N-acetylmuramoyl-L-alanyl-D-glutamate--2,6-diaminopimelate ligase
VRGADLETTLSGLSLSVETGEEKGRLTATWLGRFNAYNLLAVLAVLLEQGMGLEVALARLARLPAVPGRMEALGQADQPQVVVDYAHTPDALEKVLAALRQHCEGRLICVFGCGGDRDRGKRPLMGKVAEQGADQILVTDDNPRHEDPAEIIEDILKGLQKPDQARVVHDRNQAIALALSEAGPQDLVVVCGKGHETGQCIGDTIRPFDDRESVKSLLEAWRE